MSAALDRVPVAEIGARAREVRFSRTLLAAITGILFGTAWLIARIFSVAWLALAWAATAVRIGYQSGAGRTAIVPRSSLEAEVEHLRAEVTRLTGG